MDLKQNSQKNLLAILLAVLVVAAGVYFYVSKKSAQPQPQQNQKQNTAAGPLPVYAPDGQAVASFPKELILDSKARVNSSYSIDYSVGQQSTVTSLSSSTPKSVFDRYKAYFKANGWKVTNENSGTSGLWGLYAVKNNLQANVVITVQGKQTQIIASYLNQK